MTSEQFSKEFGGNKAMECAILFILGAERYCNTKDVPISFQEFRLLLHIKSFGTSLHRKFLCNETPYSQSTVDKYISQLYRHGYISSWSSEHPIKNFQVSNNGNKLIQDLFMDIFGHLLSKETQPKLTFEEIYIRYRARPFIPDF